MGEQQRALAGIDLFRDLSDAELGELAAKARHAIYRKGQTILSIDDERDGVFALITGAARLYRTSLRGQEVTMAIFRRGDLFGLSLLPRGTRPQSAFVSIRDGTIVYHLPRDYFLSLARVHPQIAMEAMDLLGRRLNDMCYRIEDLSAHSVRSRVAHMLASLAESSEDDPKVKETHQEIASLTGTRQDEVSKALRVLQREGLIESRPHRPGIVVLDVERLMSYGH